MRESSLDSETILSATEDVLRRHGPAKATVVDVARALGVSHGTVYRHYPSKAALREAVTRRWIETTHVGLADAIDGGGATASDRLHHWLRVMFHTKRRAALDEPELFDTFCALVTEQSNVVAEHVTDLVTQISVILADGVQSGEFQIRDLRAAARGVFDATSRFHHPAHVEEWKADDIDRNFDTVCDMILRGLQAR